MTAYLAQRPRRAIERLYRRHVGDVYRYALALLGNPAEAEDVTRATFATAYVALARGEAPTNARTWLTGLALELCRQRIGATPTTDTTILQDALALLPDVVPTGDDLLRAVGHLPPDRPAAPTPDGVELAPGGVETLAFRARRAPRAKPAASLTCGEAERALSRQLDGALTAAEAPALQAHVRRCAACAAFDRRQRAQSSALRALARVPVPAVLAPAPGRGSAGLRSP